LAREFDAVQDSFDERYNFTDYGKQRGDANFYCTGRIGKHNIVLVCLPEMGKRNAASIASTLRISFAKIELALLVGVCGGVPFPSPDTEIILGDVIIGTKVIEYDFGKQYPGGFQLKGNFIETIGRADRDIRSILSVLNTKIIKDEFQERHLCHLMDLQKLRNTWRYPGIKKDRLFKRECLHKHYGHSPETGPACALCQSNQDFICDKALKSDCDALGCTGEVVQREQLKKSDPRPRTHLGSFASGDTVMKSSKHRDRLVEKTGISGFEMEAAAISDSLRCVIIKGVSDYSDSHKNDIWQNYAAATAASCAKAFIEILSATIPEGVFILALELRSYLY
jgi:nucleoside phosphorylase